jgi:uncharacterized protein YukE
MSAMGKLTVPQLWALAQLEGDPATEKQVAAWKETARSVDTHLSELRKAASELALAWPPDKSTAAQSFLDSINDLMKSMEQTCRAAGNTAAALNGINQIINETKVELGKLNDEWQKKAAKEHENNTDSVKDTVVKFFTEDDLPDNWRDQLNQKAAKELDKLDNQVAEAYTTFEKPPKYVASIIWIDDPESGNPGGGTAGAGGATLGAGMGAAYSAAAASVIPPLAPPPALPSVGGGPALSGGPIGSPAPGPVIGGSPTPLPGGGGPVPGMPTPPGGSPLPGRVIGAGPGGVRPPVAQPGMGGMPARPAAPAARVMPPGGVIGGKPSLGQPGAAGTPGAGATRRVMPSGGVIGGSRTGEATRGGTGQSGRAGMLPQQAAGRRDRRDGDDRNRFDPNDPWRVEQGVAGVIVPPAESESHDPGPGVIGMDR